MTFNARNMGIYFVYLEIYIEIGELCDLNMAGSIFCLYQIFATDDI